MNREVEKLVLELRQRIQQIRSFEATFTSVSHSELLPIDSHGTARFAAPDRFRTEAVMNGRRVITVRQGTLVETYLPDRREAWRYDAKDLPAMLRPGREILDTNDPFAWVQEESLDSGGALEIEGTEVYRFTAEGRRWADQGVLDTRKGFSIPYRQKYPEMSMTLFVAATTGILRRRVVTDKAGKEMARLDFLVQAINVPLDEKLFRLEAPPDAFQRISLMDALAHSMDPDAADRPPSLN